MLELFAGELVHDIEEKRVAVLDGRRFRLEPDRAALGADHIGDHVEAGVIGVAGPRDAGHDPAGKAREQARLGRVEIDIVGRGAGGELPGRKGRCAAPAVNPTANAIPATGNDDMLISLGEAGCQSLRRLLDRALQVALRGTK